MPRQSRSYSLIFGETINLDFFTTPVESRADKVLTLEKYYSESNPSAYLITKHEISFRITKSEGANNKAEITIDNLSESTISYLLSKRTDNLVVMFKVGYDGDNKLLFQGVMKDCEVTKTSNTSKCKLTLSDGEINSTKAFTSRVYPAGTKAQRIIDDLILDQGTPIGNVTSLPQSAILKTPMTIFGESNRNLKRICSQYGYTTTINEGKCYVLPQNSKLPNSVAYISLSSGLIGNVQGLVSSSKQDEKTSADLSGLDRIRFTCQMDASISPQSSIYVKDPAREIDSAYKVEKAVFVSSSYEGGSWNVTVDASRTSDTIGES